MKLTKMKKINYGSSRCTINSQNSKRISSDGIFVAKYVKNQGIAYSSGVTLALSRYLASSGS